MKERIYLIPLLGFLIVTAQAKIRLPNLVSNGMVLQQQSTTKIWGWGKPGETVSFTASWNSQDTLKATTNGNGKWQIQLKTPSAGGPFNIDLKCENQIQIKDVWIGEVWVCSGQSNMEFN